MEQTEVRLVSQEALRRERQIIKISIVGIVANVFLAAFKAAAGLLSHSIAVTLDAVNNLSDALSSVVTIVGARLSGKQPDKKHPLGHGRVEFLSAAVIAVIVLYAGVSALAAAVKKIITPETPSYSTVTLVILAAAVAVKIALGLFVRRAGTRVRSDALVNSGMDALFDAVISASTLLAAGLFLWRGISLEAPLGAMISVYIVKSGVGMLRDAASKLIGERVAGDLARAVKETICAQPEVYGAYDLVLHSYGPDHWQGSVHIEVPDIMTADAIDRLERDIQAQVYQKHKVILTGIGIYAMNTQDDDVKRLQTELTRFVMAQPDVLQMHGFYFDREKKELRFDVIIDFEVPDRAVVYEKIVAGVRERYPDLTPIITMDADISD